MVAMLDAAVRPDNSAVAELHAMSNGSNSLTRNGAFDFKQSGARPDCGSLDLRTQWEVHTARAAIVGQHVLVAQLTPSLGRVKRWPYLHCL